MSKFKLMERVWTVNNNTCTKGTISLVEAFDDEKQYIINIDGGESIITSEETIFTDKKDCQEYLDRYLNDRYSEFRDDKMNSLADLLAYLILDKKRHDIIPDEIEHAVMMEKASQFTGLDMQAYLSVYKSMTRAETVSAIT